MEEEKKIFDLTNEELINFIHTQRKIMCMEEYSLEKNNLLNIVRRILDLRDLMKLTKSNNGKTRKVINKYAKSFKKEDNVKKLLKKQKHDEDIIELMYISSMMYLMELVHKIISMESFEKDLPALEKFYEFEMEDMVLVNSLIRELKYRDSLNVTEEDTLEALNQAIYEYTYCIENDMEYINIFEPSFNFVTISKAEEDNDEKQEEQEDTNE